LNLQVLILFTLLILPAGTLFAETSEQQALDAIQRQYEKVLTFEADFTQKSYVKMMNQTQSVKGTVKIKKPGKMKWVYGAPDTQILISDGKTLWLYVPEEEQATKVPVESIYSSNTPALFLAGKGKLTQSFNVESVSEEDENILVTLVPKNEDQGLARLILYADLLSPFPVPFANGFSFEKLYQKKENMASIQNWNWQKVEQAQVNAQKCGQADELAEALFHLLPINLKN